jgi:hypothetical protein
MRVMLLLMPLLVDARAADIIDRIAVTIDNRVITETEIVLQIRVTAFLNEEKPDYTAENKRRTAERLVEQTLIRRDIDSTRYINPAEVASAPAYENLRKRYSDEAAYRRALSEYEITDEDVRQGLAWQATLLDYIEVRFRPGVQVPEIEIKDYYEYELPAPKPPLQEVRAQIEAILTQRRVDSALDRWLGHARTQTRIRYKEEVFR